MSSAAPARLSFSRGHLCCGCPPSDGDLAVGSGDSVDWVVPASSPLGWPPSLPPRIVTLSLEPLPSAANCSAPASPRGPGPRAALLDRQGPAGLAPRGGWGEEEEEEEEGG